LREHNTAQERCMDCCIASLIVPDPLLPFADRMR
jgi:hypothetical protein